MSKGFGQFCPVALASEVLTQRWMLLILRELSAGSTRFNDIKRGVPRISATLLKQRLQELEFAEIVERKPSRRGDFHDYVLSEAGRELKPILSQIGIWGQRWARDIGPDDLDPDWLVWNIRRRLNSGAMPSGKTVLQFEFTDAPKAHKFFWLVHDQGAVDVCVKHPGFPVDLSVVTTVRIMAEVWRGVRSVRREIATKSIVLDGKSALRRAFSNWLLLSVYAPIERKRGTTGYANRDAS